jgi:hypothetical protein
MAFSTGPIRFYLTEIARIVAYVLRVGIVVWVDVRRIVPDVRDELGLVRISTCFGAATVRSAERFQAADERR